MVITEVVESAEKVDLGQYYTVPHLVKACLRLAKQHLSRPNIYAADLAAGGGAFIEGFDPRRVFAADIDEKAILLLRKIGITAVQGNTLTDLSRAKFGWTTEKVVIVGNPPWNDPSSLHKRKIKDQTPASMDENLRSRDLGISFLRAFARLQPVAICVLHPWSYLLKKMNFASLKEFSQGYRLQDAFIFSSTEFPDLSTKTPFPVVAALYVPGQMTYEEICKFPFAIWESKNGVFAPTGKKIVIANVTTVRSTKFVRENPPPRSVPEVQRISPLGLYQFNFRDQNQVCASAAISTRYNEDSSIPVTAENLWRYAYVNVSRRYAGQNFVFGNFSPLVNLNVVGLKWFQDACVIDVVMDHPNLEPFRRDNPANLVESLGILANAKQEAATFSGVPNFYEAFVSYWSNGDFNQRRVLRDYFRRYFVRLRDGSLS